MNKPFVLSPTGKDYLWGGNRLNEIFHKGIDLSPLAESWECSVHPDGPSIIASGEFKGEKLVDVLNSHPQFLGFRKELPILVKLIDAKQSLSVQVHPSDEYANKYENGQLGKTEMWVILEADENAKLVYGLTKDMTKEAFTEEIENGTLENVLHYIPVKKNDVFFIEAGTIHAIGAGCLIAEIQENSNLTYRVYDFNRVGKDGKKRELHVQKALEVSMLKKMDEIDPQRKITKATDTYTESDLAKCEYFDVKRIEVLSEKKIKTEKDNFKVLLFTDGDGILNFEDGALSVTKGQCVFVPADSVDIVITGQCQLLEIEC